MLENSGNKTAAKPDDPSEMKCIACYNDIHVKARLCPFCGTKQSLSMPQILMSSLKWIGGLTAVITLVISAVNLNDIVISSKSRSAAVTQLVTGASRMKELGNVDDAFALIAKALLIDATSKAALDFQIDLAMEKVRNVSKSMDEKEGKIFEQMISIIERGVGDSRNGKVADALAHLGWSNYLRSKGRESHNRSDPFFQKAFELDPDNYYAHLLRAKWCLAKERNETIDHPVDQAMEHFRKLESQKKANPQLDKEIWYGLIQSRDESAKTVLLNRVNEYRKQKKKIDRDVQESLVYLFCNSLNNEEKLTQFLQHLPALEIKQSFDWLQAVDPNDPGKNIDCSGTFQRRYLSILLDDLSGNALSAIARYRKLLSDIRKKRGTSAYQYMEEGKIVLRLAQFFNIRPAAVGISGEDLYGEFFETLTQQWCCGLRVKDIVPSGPADSAGMKFNDIITRVNGQTPEGDLLDHIAVIGIPGKNLSLSVYRNDGDRVNLICQTREMSALETKKFFSFPWNNRDPHPLRLLDRYLYPSGILYDARLRARITDLTETACKDFSIPEGTKGALVLSTRARIHKLAAGDVILKTNDSPVTTIQDMTRYIDQATSEKEHSLKLTIRRDGKNISFFFPLYKE